MLNIYVKTYSFTIYIIDSCIPGTKIKPKFCKRLLKKLHNDIVNLIKGEY